VAEIYKNNFKEISLSNHFRSERDMQSFLYNNPIIVSKLYNSEGELSSPIIREFSTKRGEDKKGRIDLLALSNSGGELLLEIIELKMNAEAGDNKQLKEYLTGLNEKKEEIFNIIKKETKIKDESEIENCYSNRIGRFIVMDFDPKLFIKIHEWNSDSKNKNKIDLNKLILFNAMESNNKESTTYIVLDKIIENKKPRDYLPKIGTIVEDLHEVKYKVTEELRREMIHYNEKTHHLAYKKKIHGKFIDWVQKKYKVEFKVVFPPIYNSK